MNFALALSHTGLELLTLSISLAKNKSLPFHFQVTFLLHLQTRTQTHIINLYLDLFRLMDSLVNEFLCSDMERLFIISSVIVLF